MFVAGGDERYAFKCMSVGLRKGFTGCKNAMTSRLPVTNLIALSFSGLFFLSNDHTLLSPAYKKPLLIGI